MNAWWLLVAAAGAAVLTASVAAARHETMRPWERRAFHALNGQPDWLHPFLWVPMQLGNLVVGTLAGLAVAAVGGDLTVAIGVILAMVLKLITERVLRREMAGYIEVRQRPGTSQVDAVLRGDVPSSGPSFPSGHVILVAAIAIVVEADVGPAWWWLSALLVLVVMVGRVYVGAHNPLDVTAGLGAGMILGGVMASFVD